MSPALAHWSAWLKKLRETWSVDAGHCGAICLSNPGIGYVTVDFVLRNYTLGCSPVLSRGKYKGKRWQEKLMTDAINALEKCK